MNVILKARLIASQKIIRLFKNLMDTIMGIFKIVVLSSSNNALKRLVF